MKATKKVDEPLKKGQSLPTEKQTENNEKIKTKEIKQSETSKKSRGRKI